MAKKVLIVDDDRHICEITKLYFEKNQFDVTLAFDGHATLYEYEKYEFDLIILDLMLPYKDGWSVCRQIRSSSNVPIIMLTAKGEVVDKIEGLNMGADDYVQKPFDPNELIARATAVLRRHSHPGYNPRNGLIRHGSLSINKEAYQVFQNGEPVSLTRREIELLTFMAEHPNQVFSREQCIERIWGLDFEGEDRVVDLYIKRLREKLRISDEDHWKIHTVYGVGYQFEVNR